MSFNNSVLWRSIAFKHLSEFLMFFAGLLNAVSAESLFPIGTIYTADEVPVALIIGMESKPRRFVSLQLDTGSPISILYQNPGNPPTLDERLMQLSTSIEPPFFLGDSGNRAHVRLKGEYTVFDTTAAILNLGRRSVGVVGVLGFNWFYNKEIDIQFDKKLLEIRSKGESANELMSATSVSTEISVRASRIEVPVCFSRCDNLVFDTGITISDVVEFVALERLINTVSADELIDYPGVLGAIRCRRPRKLDASVSIGGKSVKDLYSTICSFLDLPEFMPNWSVMGIRSIIEKKGRIVLDMREKRLQLDYKSLGM